MANVTRTNGFRPVKHLNGSPYNGQFNIYEIVAGDGTLTNIGDLVKGDAGTATDVYPTCVRGGTTGEVTNGVYIGVIVGFVQSPLGSGQGSTVGTQPVLDVPSMNSRAASTKKYAMVADAPDLVFEVKDGGTVPCTLTLIGMNTGFMATAGSTTTGASGMTSGATAPTTTSTLPLRIMGIVNSPDNASAATDQRLLVMINAHQYGSVGTAGI
jgi:hypothetical protein